MTNTLLDGTMIRSILPLSCLLLGTAAFGNEIDGGTILYVLTKPIRRSEIVMAKFVASASLVGVFLVPATAIAGLIAAESSSDTDVVVGFTIAVALGVLAYTALFIVVSLVTQRALLFGLAYILVWEAIATDLFSATVYLSIRQYCLSIAGLLSNVSQDTFDPKVAPAVAPVLAIAVTIGALVMAVQRLEKLQIKEPE
jgi:ABC-2 type transport system permease protein